MPTPEEQLAIKMNILEQTANAGIEQLKIKLELEERKRQLGL
jgi:hypothetical protein